MVTKRPHSNMWRYQHRSWFTRACWMSSFVWVMDWWVCWYHVNIMLCQLFLKRDILFSFMVCLCISQQHYLSRNKRNETSSHVQLKTQIKVEKGPNEISLNLLAIQNDWHIDYSVVCTVQYFMLMDGLGEIICTLFWDVVNICKRSHAGCGRWISSHKSTLTSTLHNRFWMKNNNCCINFMLAFVVYDKAVASKWQWELHGLV